MSDETVPAVDEHRARRRRLLMQAANTECPACRAMLKAAANDERPPMPSPVWRP